MCAQAVKLNNYRAVVNKWLHAGEELDYDSSRYSEGYFALRVKENGEFVLVPGDSRRGRIIFAKETNKGLTYLYDSVQLYRDWIPDNKDFSKLSALDINIYIHLVISLYDDLTATIGIMKGLGEDIGVVMHRYLTVCPAAKGADALAMMQSCANLFLNPSFCYNAFYLTYEKMNMAREAGIAREMMGRV